MQKKTVAGFHMVVTLPGADHYIVHKCLCVPLLAWTHISPGADGTRESLILVYMSCDLYVCMAKCHHEVLICLEIEWCWSQQKKEQLK